MCESGRAQGWEGLRPQDCESMSGRAQTWEGVRPQDRDCMSGRSQSQEGGRNGVWEDQM